MVKRHKILSTHVAAPPPPRIWTSSRYSLFSLAYEVYIFLSRFSCFRIFLWISIFFLSQWLLVKSEYLNGPFETPLIGEKPPLYSSIVSFEYTFFINKKISQYLRYIYTYTYTYNFNMIISMCPQCALRSCTSWGCATQRCFSLGFLEPQRILRVDWPTT